MTDGRQRDIAVGATFAVTYTVDDPRAIGFMGPELRVYGTPFIVLDTEQACRLWLLDHISPDEDSVGYLVEIRHKRPTPMGMTATHDAKVVEVDGDRVTFEVSVRDAIEEVATVRHTRVIVEKTRLAKTVQAKRDRAATA